MKPPVLDSKKLAELASCLMIEVSASHDDNQITVAKFRDRRGRMCALELTVKEISNNQQISSSMNCVVGEAAC